MSAAGKYRERITIYTPAPKLKDRTGGNLPTGPDTAVTVWARVQMLQAKEYFFEGKITYSQPYKITLRAEHYDLTNSKRVVWGDVKISVNSVIRDEKKTEIYLYGIGS